MKTAFWTREFGHCGFRLLSRGITQGWTSIRGCTRVLNGVETLEDMKAGKKQNVQRNMCLALGIRSNVYFFDDSKPFPPTCSSETNKMKRMKKIKLQLAPPHQFFWTLSYAGEAYQIYGLYSNYNDAKIPISNMERVRNLLM